MKITANNTAFTLLAAFTLQASIISAAFAKDTLKPGESIGSYMADPMLTSADGRFTFIMQTDGNLVLYMGDRSLWSSRTAGKWSMTYDLEGRYWYNIYPDKLQLYTSSWLEIRDIADEARFWQANTWDWMNRHYGSIGLPTPTDLAGDTLIVQNDGNVVLYDTRSSPWKPVWATDTSQPAQLKLSWSAQSLPHIIGRVDADGWSANTAQDPVGYLQYGPYTTQVTGGAHTALWNLMIDNNTADDLAIVRVDVYDATDSRVLASRDIRRKQWTSTFRYQPFLLPFTVNSAQVGHLLEFRVYWYKHAYIREQNVNLD
ncbi:hypothetical protein WME91_11235 [Sorangium sp. So ce269]